MQSRKQNYELLRIISALSVIAIHVAAIYTSAFRDGCYGMYYREHYLTTCIYYCMTRFAVPCFIMLAGVFAIGNDKNANFKYWYRKMFKRIVVPTVIFTLFYMVYSIAFRGEVKGQPIGVKNYILTAFKGKPFNHMWYLYMIIPVYMFTPFVIRAKRDIGEKHFAQGTAVFFIWAMLSLWTSKHELQWDITMAFGYLGYFMLGYVIATAVKSEQTNAKALIFIALGLMVFGVLTYLRYKQGMNGIEDSELKRDLVWPYSPVPVVGSVLIFIGFAKLRFTKDVSKVSTLMFEVYLIHSFVNDVLQMFITDAMDNRIVIPVMVVVVFVISLVLGRGYKWLYDACEIKWKVGKRAIQKSNSAN